MQNVDWKEWVMEWTGYALDCYDYQSTCGAKNHYAYEHKST